MEGTEGLMFIVLIIAPVACIFGYFYCLALIDGPHKYLQTTRTNICKPPAQKSANHPHKYLQNRPSRRSRSAQSYLDHLVVERANVRVLRLGQLLQFGEQPRVARLDNAFAREVCFDAGEGGGLRKREGGRQR